MTMRKNYLRLFLLIAFLFTVYSCVHDEVYSSENPVSEVYSSKSFWKEDEKYIKNVIKIYAEHESEIKRMSGIPKWEYAMSMGRYDETFLVVPIVENNKVVSTLSCARFDKKVYFKYDNTPGNIVFFDKMLFGKYTRHKTETNKNNASSAQKGSICVTNFYSVWFPDNENDYWGSGHWESYSYQNCYSYQDYSNPDFNEGGSSGGFDYGGGGGSGSTTDPNNPQNLPPCEKLKSQNAKPEFKSKITDLLGKLGLTGETGYVEKTNGTFEYKNVASSSENANSLTLGNPTADMLGFLHTHVNDYTDDDGMIHIGFKIFSPADVIYFNQLVALAQQNGIPLDNIYAVMVSGTGTYQLRFTGNINQIKTVYANTKQQYNEMYIKYFQVNDTKSDELNFLKFMDEQMYVKGVSLVKMNNDGSFTAKTLNADKTGVSDSECPN